MLNVKKVSEEFNKNGYIILKNFLSKEDIIDLKNEIISTYNRFLDDRISHKNIDKIITEYEKQKAYNQLYKAFLKITKLKNFTKISKKLEILSKKLFNTKTKNITNGITIGIKNYDRTSYEWHQEKPYYKKISTLHFQFPIFGPCTKKNGTMSVLKKSHKYGYLAEVNNLVYGKKHINSFVPKKINIIKKKTKEIFFNMKLKDLAIFHENLIHKSNKNFTNKIRFAGIIRLKLN